jgi:tRNA-specific 2-thiouridylase
LTASEVNWIAGHPPVGPLRITAQIRHRHTAASATAHVLEDRRVRVEFDEPQPAIAPGQAVVLYGGEQVLGGGWIE